MIKKTLIGMILVLCALMCACSHTPDEKEAIDPAAAERLYQDAMELYKKRSWAYAFDDFQKVRTRYPLSEWGVKSELKLADCLYYQNQYAGALTQYQEFARLHPTHDSIDYVHYQMGMCYYKQLCSIDRDQSFAIEAIKQFKRLISMFPSSQYVPSATEKIEISARLLAAHWIYIADFYYRTKCYPAALARYQEAIKDHFPYLEDPDHVFYMLGKTYLRLNKPDQARLQFARIVLDYPEGEYAPKAKTLVEDPEDIHELDGLTFDDIVEGINPFYECESPIDPKVEQCKVKKAEETIKD